MILTIFFKTSEYLSAFSMQTCCSIVPICINVVKDSSKFLISWRLLHFYNSLHTQYTFLWIEVAGEMCPSG